MTTRLLDARSSLTSRLSQPKEDLESPETRDEKWVVPNLRKSFLKSLSKDEGDENPPPNMVGARADPKNCYFSMESILKFKNSQLEIEANSKQTTFHRARPNYDNRKRSFLAMQQPDRKK